MLAVLSPAKSLDYSEQFLTKKKSTPGFLDDSEVLIAQLKGMTAAQLSKLMGISAKLGELNYERNQAWQRPFPKGEAKQALLAFKGDVYQGFELDRYQDADWPYAQDHLRILSGLYGLLRPLDLILPYRLEMGTKMATDRGKDLYEFWGTKITDALNKALKKQGDDVLVNLASNEYFGSVKTSHLKGRVVTPIFKDTKNGKLKIISFYAKRARGMMADFMIRNRISKPGDLRQFDTAGYGYDANLSSEDTLVFTRGEQ